MIRRLSTCPLGRGVSTLFGGLFVIAVASVEFAASQLLPEVLLPVGLLCIAIGLALTIHWNQTASATTYLADHLSVIAGLYFLWGAIHDQTLWIIVGVLPCLVVYHLLETRVLAGESPA